jgi:hypothetical protein
LIVGSVLSGLLFYADRVMTPSSLPFSTSQSIGLPEPYKATVTAVEKPEIVAAAVAPPDEMSKPVKAVRKRISTRAVSKSAPQERYSAYPVREYGSIW